jgi:hypothetical protein
MHWHLEPLILPVLIAILLLLAIPHAHPGTPTQEPSPAIRRACDNDVRRLCPKEYAARDGAAIHACMKEHALQVSLRCAAAWLREHK